MKILSWFIGILFTLLVLVYVVLFTPFGNGLLKPYLESQIDVNTKLDSKLKVFTLSLSDFDILIDLNKNNTIHVKGNYSLFSQAFDMHYKVKLEALKSLKPLTQTQLLGSFHTNGEVKGDMKLINIDGTSDIASSATQFHALLENFTPKSLQAKVKHLKLQRALYMLKQPHYTDGLLDVNINISDADMKNLQGSVQSKIYKGKLDSKYLTKAYEFNSTMPTTTFHLATFTTLNKNMANTKVNLNSNLANLAIKNAQFNIADASIASDYLVQIPNLDKLFFVTARHLKGNLSANGDLKKGKDLDFTADSNVANGKLDAHLHNDDFHATLSSMQTLKVLDMLLYPKIFKSNIDGVVDYNIAQAKGTFNAKLSNGKFTKNRVLNLAKKYASTDLYKDIFKGDVNAKIRKEYILASLDLKSNRSAIVTKNTHLNSLTKKINSKIDINANGNPFIVYLSGKTNAPKVKVNANKLIKREATKAAKRFLKKQGTKGLEKKAQQLLKGFF